MRIFSSFTEMLDEVVRDVWTRGQVSFDPTVQGKLVERNDYEMLELVPYDYTVSAKASDIREMVKRAAQHFPSYEDTAARLDKLFFDRIAGYSNPEPTIQQRPYWRELMEPNGKFSYSYAERLSNHEHYLDALKRNKSMRGCFISIWDASKDFSNVGSGRRVPCSIGYHLLIRKGELSLIYFMRACDLARHFASDVYLAREFQAMAAEYVGAEIGTFTHFISSLHVYKKDVPNDRKW